MTSTTIQYFATLFRGAGCVVLFMLTGRHPFPDYKTELQHFIRLNNGEKPLISEDISDEPKVFSSDITSPSRNIIVNEISPAI